MPDSVLKGFHGAIKAVVVREGVQYKSVMVCAHLLLLYTVSVSQAFWAELLVASGTLALVLYSLLPALQMPKATVQSTVVELCAAGSRLWAACRYLVTSGACLAAIYSASL